MEKYSYYNFIFTHNNEPYCYNALTGKLAILSKQTMLLMNENNLNDISDKETMRQLGFITNSDELKMIENRFLEAKRVNKTLTITIIPTMSCNNTCSYCFQKKHSENSVMSEEIINKVLIFFESIIVNDINKIIVNWFGGEPLLEYGIILKMGMQIKEIARKNSKELEMVIITNGELLSEELARQLAELGNISAQLTIDSLYYKKGVSRGILMHDGSISTLLKNIINSKKHIRMIIRINVSKNNKNDVEKIVNILKENQLENEITLGNVTEYYNMKNMIDQNSVFLPIENYAMIESAIYKNSIIGIKHIQRKLIPKAHACAATLRNTYVIDPEGYISRCWHSAGNKSESISSLLKNNIEDFKINEIKWEGYLPSRIEKCKICKFLPICMGSCPHDAVFYGQSSPCESISVNIISLLQDTIGKIKFEEFQQFEFENNNAI
jgi:uncharacterized protein